MSEVIIIQRMPHQHEGHDCDTHIPLRADRATIAKRRWRGVAEDGKEFGFDLDAALGHGIHFHYEGNTSYILEQSPEPVLEIPVTTAEQAARVAWNLGNLHFGIQVLPEAVRVTEDPAVLQFLAREGVSFRRVNALFQPLSAGAHHHSHEPSHSHGHSHG
jgi:urease accessory protein